MKKKLEQDYPKPDHIGYFFLRLFLIALCVVSIVFGVIYLTDYCANNSISVGLIDTTKETPGVIETTADVAVSLFDLDRDKYINHPIIPILHKIDDSFLAVGLSDGSMVVVFSDGSNLHLKVKIVNEDIIMIDYYKIKSIKKKI